MRTPTQRLADALIPGGDLDRFVADRRPDKSWRLIALDIRDATNGSLDLAAQTLHGWYAELEREPAA